MTRARHPPTPAGFDLELFRQLADVSNDAFYLADDTGRLRYVNERAVTLTGFSRDELLAMTVFDIDPEYTREHFDTMVAALAESPVPPFEADAQRKDGTRFPTEVSPSRIEIDGQVFFFGAVRDISERRQIDTVQKDFAQRMLQTVETERQRIARELHDDIGQAVATLGVLLKALEQTRGIRGTPTAHALGPIHASLGSVTESIARIVRDYHPADLLALGLEEAVRMYARQFASRHGLTLRLSTIPLDGVLSAEHELHVYRIVQGALANVVQHANARRLTVRIRRHGRKIELLVRDEGRGFVDAAADDATQKLGLVTMQERAALIAGTLAVQSSPGRGAEVRLALSAESRDRSRVTSVRNGRRA
jgi:PAS domain S-box-containing protein